MVSKTRTGPVLPMMVSGCPENSAYDIPQMAPDNKLSIVDCRRKQKTEIEINSSLLMTARHWKRFFYQVIHIPLYMFQLNHLLSEQSNTLKIMYLMRK